MLKLGMILLEYECEALVSPILELRRTPDDVIEAIGVDNNIVS